MARSPATNSPCHRRPTDCMASHIPVGLSVPPRDLTPTTGARTTRFDRPHQCVLARRCRSLTSCPALRPHAHTTPSRPPHPAPTFVTIAIRRSQLGGMREGTTCFWKTEAKYFSRGDWTTARHRGSRRRHDLPVEQRPERGLTGRLPRRARRRPYPADHARRL